MSSVFDMLGINIREKNFYDIPMSISKTMALTLLT